MFMFRFRVAVWTQWLDIKRHFRNIRSRTWWSIVGRSSVVVRWPNGWTKPDHLGNQFLSSDPNDHYREWLEDNVGKQGWSWQWYPEPDGTLRIYFRKNKEKEMILAALRWS